MKRYIHFKLLCALALAMGAGILLHFGIGTPYQVMAQNYGPQDTHIVQAALGTAFTYQGRLIQNGVPVSATCDFQFALYDAASGGNPVGSPQTTSAAVSDGYFNATLDFGDIFQGDARYLSIAVQCPGDPDFVPLGGRVALRPAPYANYATSAPWIGLNGVPAGFADGLDDDTTYNAGDGLSITGTTFDVSYSGSGSATTVARSDHDHWGQTWSGTGTGLVITGTHDWMALLEITNNGTGSSHGLRATAGGYGSGVAGRNLNGTGPGIYGCSSSNGCSWSSGSIGVEGFSDDPGGYGIYGVGDTAVLGLSSSPAGAGGRFTSVYAGSQAAETAALWLGAYQSDLIQGHQTDYWGDSTDMPFRVDYTGTVHATGGYFTRTDDYALVADGPALDYSPNPEQIALLRWYDTISPDALQGIYVGSSPRHAAFDGDHIWVTNGNDHTVTKIRASDGAIVGTYPLGTSCGPSGIAFDGLSMWIGCWSDQVIEMRARDGIVMQILNFPTGSQPRTVAFDGRYVWVARAGDGRVTRMVSHSPTVSDTFTLGGEPSGLAFDGRYMWVTNYTDGTVTRLLSATPTVSDTFAVGAGPRGIAFDGARMWIGNALGGTVVSLRVTDGSQVSSIAVANMPSEVVFDGGYIWVTSYGGDTVTKIRAIDADVVGSYFAGNNPLGMAFDGANVWVVSVSLGVVGKH